MQSSGRVASARRTRVNRASVLAEPFRECFPAADGVPMALVQEAPAGVASLLRAPDRGRSPNGARVPFALSAMGRLRKNDSVCALEAEHLVGRSPFAALQIDRPYVSQQHALIRWAPGGWELKDLGSRNGTFVNGAPIPGRHAQKIVRGDRIAFGDTEQSWEFVDDEGPRTMVVPIGDSSEPGWRRRADSRLASRGR